MRHERDDPRLVNVAQFSEPVRETNAIAPCPSRVAHGLSVSFIYSHEGGGEPVTDENLETWGLEDADPGDKELPEFMR